MLKELFERLGKQFLLAFPANGYTHCKSVLNNTEQNGEGV
jgi:hypothetical protein